MNGTIPPVSGVQPKSSSLAIWSLVLGILGLVLLCIGPLFAIPGVICGHMAHSRIKRSGGALTGGGLALGGLITGYVSIALGIFLVPMMAAIAIPNFVKARDISQSNACIKNLQIINSVKHQWALANKQEATATATPADLDKYFNKGFSELTCPKGGTYTIGSMSESPSCTIPGHEVP